MVTRIQNVNEKEKKIPLEADKPVLTAEGKANLCRVVCRFIFRAVNCVKGLDMNNRLEIDFLF